MIPVPTDDLVLICIWLLFNAIVDDQHPVRTFDRPHEAFHLVPQLCAIRTFAIQEAGNFIMTDFSACQLGQAGCRRWSK